MGYDIEMKIGRLGLPQPEFKRSETGELDGKKLYHPYLEDEKGEWIKSGRKERTFYLEASIDLCVIGQGPLTDLVEKCKVEKKVKTKEPIIKWQDEGFEVEEDSYGVAWKPVTIKEVIKALKAELKGNKEPYRRFVWALGLLEGMKDTADDMVVLFHGH